MKPSSCMAPQNTAQTTLQVYIRWSAPMDNGGSEVLSYTVRYEDQTGDVETFANLTPGDDVWAPEELLVTSLVEGQLYTFYVQAVNAIGTSGASPALTVVAATPAGRYRIVACRIAAYRIVVLPSNLDSTVSVSQCLSFFLSPCR